MLDQILLKDLYFEFAQLISFIQCYYALYQIHWILVLFLLTKTCT